MKPHEIEIMKDSLHYFRLVDARLELESRNSGNGVYILAAFRRDFQDHMTALVETLKAAGVEVECATDYRLAVMALTVPVTTLEEDTDTCTPKK